MPLSQRTLRYSPLLIVYLLISTIRSLKTGPSGKGSMQRDCVANFCAGKLRRSSFECCYTTVYRGRNFILLRRAGPVRADSPRECTMIQESNKKPELFLVRLLPARTHCIITQSNECSPLKSYRYQWPFSERGCADSCVHFPGRFAQVDQAFRCITGNKDFRG